MFFFFFVFFFGSPLGDVSEQRYQASEPLIRAGLPLPVSTAQDPAKQNQHSDPWQNHILISQTVQVNSLCFGSAVLLLLLDSNLIVQVSDLSNEAPSQSWMIDVFAADFLLFFFLTPQCEESRKCECEDMNNALEDGCLQMKGHSWLILFFLLFSSRFFFEMAKERKKDSFSLCSSLTVLRLDCKTSFLSKMVEIKLSLANNLCGLVLLPNLDMYKNPYFITSVKLVPSPSCVCTFVQSEADEFFIYMREICVGLTSCFGFRTSEL